MKRLFVCPDTEKEYSLPANLYQHNRKHKGKWRYKGGLGLRDIWEYIHQLDDTVPVALLSPEEAIKVADDLNAFYGKQTKKKSKKAMKTTLHREVAMYLDEKNLHKPSSVGSPYFKRREGYLNELADDLSMYKVSNLNRDILKAFFYGTGSFKHRADDKKCTHDAQSNRRKHYAEFFDYLMAKGRVGSVEHNYFKMGSPAEFKIVEKEKTQGIKGNFRRDLTLPEFKQILGACEGDLEWFADLLRLAVLTGQRRSDLVNTRVADYDEKNQTLLILNVKKYKQTGVRLGQLFDLSLPNQAALRSVVYRMLDRAKQTNCPYLVCQPYGRPSSNKEHPCQILEGYVTKTFEKVRKNFSDISYTVTGYSNPPTFHGIRGLTGKILLELGYSDSVIQDQYGHEGISITKHYIASEFNSVNVVKAGFDIDQIEPTLFSY